MEVLFRDFRNSVVVWPPNFSRPLQGPCARQIFYSRSRNLILSTDSIKKLSQNEKCCLRALRYRSLRAGSGLAEEAAVLRFSNAHSQVSPFHLLPLPAAGVFSGIYFFLLGVFLGRNFTYFGRNFARAGGVKCAEGIFLA